MSGRNGNGSACLSVRPSDLSVLMGIAEDQVVELAESGVIPARLGHKGLAFDLAEVQRSISRCTSTRKSVGTYPPLADLSAALGSARDRSEMFEIVAAHFIELFLGRSAIVLLVDSDAWLSSVFATGREARVDALECVAAWVAIERRPVCIGPPDEKSGSLRDDVGCVAAVPLESGDRLVGVVALETRRGAPMPDATRLRAAEALGRHAALALEHRDTLAELSATRTRTDLNQQQMEAFARDVRSTFAAEKERAEQLAAALDELERTYLATVKGLAVAVEAKDEYTAGHLQRVTRYGLAMMRIIAPDQAEDPQYEFGFLLHDVGKIAVSDAVLQKDGALTDEEWIAMRGHAEMGVRILQDIPFLAHAREIVGAHHERWDGKGYPRGLKGEEIPLGARVFSIADSFDAMCSDRPYRKALPIKAALGEISKGEGTQFWAPAVDAFLQIPVADLEEVASDRYVRLEGLR